MPESGRIVDEVKDMDYPEVIVNPCRVIYKIDTTTASVFILHIIRQERDLRRYIINESSAEYST